MLLVLAIVDEAAVNILAYDFWWMCVFISLEKLLDHKADVYLGAPARQFSKTDSHQNRGGFQVLPVLAIAW